MKRPVTYMMVLEDGTTFSAANGCKIVAVSTDDATTDQILGVPYVTIASFAERAKYDGKLDMRLYTDDDVVIGH